MSSSMFYEKVQKNMPAYTFGIYGIQTPRVFESKNMLLTVPNVEEHHPLTVSRSYDTRNSLQDIFYILAENDTPYALEKTFQWEEKYTNKIYKKTSTGLACGDSKKKQQPIVIMCNIHDLSSNKQEWIQLPEKFWDEDMFVILDKIDENFFANTRLTECKSYKVFFSFLSFLFEIA